MNGQHIPTIQPIFQTHAPQLPKTVKVQSQGICKYIAFKIGQQMKVTRLQAKVIGYNLATIFNNLYS